MILAEIIYQRSLDLPEPVAREALDFIEFLWKRYPKDCSTATQSSHTESFLAALVGGLSEDFPDDIDLSDLGVDAPQEDLD